MSASTCTRLGEPVRTRCVGCQVALRERRHAYPTISGASEPPLASCETASVLEHLWVRVDTLLTLGEGALMRLDASRLTGCEGTLLAQEFRVMLHRCLPDSETAFVPVSVAVHIVLQGPEQDQPVCRPCTRTDWYVCMVRSYSVEQENATISQAE